MNFHLSQELSAIRDAAARFTRDELIPHEPIAIRRESERGFGDMPLLPPGLESELLAKARSAGLVAIEVPAAYGGLGHGVLAKCVAVEQLKRSILFPFGFPPNFPDAYMLKDICTPEQADRYLMPFMRGEKKACIALTESGAGSDAAAIRMRAERRSGRWILNGEKIFISGARQADFMIVVTVTDPGRGSRGGMTTFLVDADTPGITIPSVYPTIAEYAPYAVHFDDVEVGDEHVLGTVGDAFAPLQLRLGVRRLEIAATCIGLATRCLDMMIMRANTRSTFGAPLADRQTVQWWIADSFQEIEMCRLATHRVAWQLDQGGYDVRRDASMAKVQASEMVGRVADRAIQLHGAVGICKQMPLEFIARLVRIYRIVEGPSEVHRWVIARDLLRNGLPH